MVRGYLYHVRKGKVSEGSKKRITNYKKKEGGGFAALGRLNLVLRGNPGLNINQGGAHVPYVTVDTKIPQHKGWHTAVSKNARFKS